MPVGFRLRLKNIYHNAAAQSSQHMYCNAEISSRRSYIVYMNIRMHSCDRAWTAAKVQGPLGSNKTCLLVRILQIFTYPEKDPPPFVLVIVPWLLSQPLITGEIIQGELKSFGTGNEVMPMKLETEHSPSLGTHG